MNIVRPLVEAQHRFTNRIIVADLRKVASVSMPLEEIVPDPELREEIVEACDGQPGVFVGDLAMRPIPRIEPDDPLARRIDEAVGELVLQANQQQR